MAEAQLSITPNFAAPFAEAFHPEAESLNRRLTELLLAAEKPENEPYPKIPTLKVNVFESDFDLLTWPDEPIQTLKRFLVGSVVRVVQNLNGYQDRQMASLSISNQSWFHITRQGGYASGHNHPMASWSSVYCVDSGDAVEGNPDSGVLRFPDPRGHASMYLDPGNTHLKRPYDFGSLNYPLKSGQLIVFPSWLSHEVAPYFGDRPRITIASNFWLKERGVRA